MKIVFTGGGTGGHFYPIIAVSERVNQIISKENIVGAKLYYISTEPYDNQALFENNLIFTKISTGKMRTYFSIKNIFDIFKTFFGVINALIKVFMIYPDVIFSKGGYAAFPVVFAARLLNIPVVIHESDASPGRVNVFASKFAKRIAISFKESIEYFPKDKTIYTGQPVRKEIEKKEGREEALRFFSLESDLPVLLILGGSQGAELINNTVIDGLPNLIKKYQVIHQTGVRNFKNVKARADVVLETSTDKARYTPIAFLNPLQLKMAAGATELIISRAGSTIFEIASWGIPSILIPFTVSNADHSKKNAFAYARVGACVVIEEMNMTANILSSEIDRIMTNKNISISMSKNALAFYKPDASNTIAREIVDIALSHEK
jgi:UDP-N-acetylglucosamine--N-acetylmuramyl-(pentapeptide) pyrophosphoryl-undecaprenol N-acetylglucosamine transferase